MARPHQSYCMIDIFLGCWYQCLCVVLMCTLWHVSRNYYFRTYLFVNPCTVSVSLWEFLWGIQY